MASPTMIIHKERGERLGLLVKAKSGNQIVNLNDGYSVDAWIKSATTRRIRESMAPMITDEGFLYINYDTAPLQAGLYHFDLRFSKAGADAFTSEISLRIRGTVTPLTTR